MGYSLHHPELGITAEVLARTLVSAAQLKPSSDLPSFSNEMIAGNSM
jgi:hypothetical protein